MKYNKETGTYQKAERVIIDYEVIQNGIVLFNSETRAMCNSFICRNSIQGVRPTPVYAEAED